MKRLFRVLAAVVMFMSIVGTAAIVRAETNLIANPSVETASGSAPANWAQSRWGTNTANFTYPTNGHTGARSLRVDMTAYTDGDAKWMHAPATITGNTSYTYTQWYKSTVATDIVVQYADASNNVTYAYVTTLPASSTWKESTLTFTTPASAVNAVVLDIVYSVGWLQTDDFSLTQTVATPPPEGNNLIANPSFETANATLPAGWANSKWGTNTTSFTYLTTGRTGTRSVRINTTAYTNGDAKWYAQPINVTPGKTYTYSDYYKATIGTHIVVAFINSAGTYSYSDVGDAAAATGWTQYGGYFTVPAGTVQATIYHLIAGVGTLTIDDVSLVQNTSYPAGTVPNPSLEEGATGPTYWQNSKWGTNTAAFAYVNEGHTGSKSAKVTVSNYTDGDAKWFFNPITLTPGNQYRFTIWYKTNTLPKAVAMFNMPDGTQKYHGMPNPQPGANAATTWQQYSDTFTVPANTVSVSVFMFLDKNGWLQTDDYSIGSYTPVGFNRPLLTLTFDDGHEDNVTNALPLLNQYNFKTTHCFATEFIEGQPQSVLDGVLAISNAGHEICSHTVTHPMLTTLNDTDLNYELQHSKQFLENLVGKPVLNFASPYGDYNAHVNSVIAQYYQSHRTVDEGFNSKDNFDKYRLRVQNIFNTTTAAEVTGWVNQAKATNTWLILVYHRIGDNPDTYDSSPAVFAQHLQAIQASGITVKTYQDALTETMSQL